MSKKVLIDTFFNQFTDFLKQLENMYPDDTDFPVFITTLDLLKSTNPMLVVKFVKENIVDLYKDKILNKDESFFLDQDYTKHGDEKRRDNFRKRNMKWAYARKYSPAWLSFYLLW